MAQLTDKQMEPILELLNDCGVPTNKSPEELQNIADAILTYHMRMEKAKKPIQSVKILTDNGSAILLEKMIADWTKEVEPNILSVDVKVTPMKDYYTHTGEICNQWIEYTAVIIYTLNQK